jgi:hypothetical protein
MYTIVVFRGSSKSGRRRSFTLDESHKLFVGKSASLQVDLDGQQQSEEELVALVKASRRVFPDGVGQIVDNVLDSFFRVRRPCRSGKG